MDGSRKIVALVLLLLTACSPLAASDPPPPKATPTVTPFQVAEATATPAEITGWLSPALPAELASAANSIEKLNGRSLKWVEQPAEAELRFEPNGETSITSWIYVVAVPFPSLERGLALEELAASFRGQAEWRVVSSLETQQAWASDWGAASISAIPTETLFDEVNRVSEPSLALMEIDKLSRRWSVLSVEAQSPFDPDFQPASYPLTRQFGVSGDPELRQAALAALEWPSSNWQPEELTTIAMTGVTALTRATAWAIERQGVDWAVSQVAPTLFQADITHISHEVAFTEACPPVNPSRDVMRFCGQPEQIEVMVAIGTDVVELTGNHVMDYGPEALLSTIDVYQQRGWQTYGGGRNLAEASQPAFLDHNDHRFAFLGCNDPGPAFAWAKVEAPGARPCDLDALYQEISTLRQQGYLPIVTFQWAESYSNWPLPKQAEAFRQAASAGAVIVSGSQAHRPQGFEFSQDGFIHFGLGNLFFDQMWSLETRQEFIDLYHFYQGQLINVELTSWMLEDYAQVRPMTEAEREQFLGDIFEASGY